MSKQNLQNTVPFLLLLGILFLYSLAQAETASEWKLSPKNQWGIQINGLQTYNETSDLTRPISRYQAAQCKLGLEITFPLSAGRRVLSSVPSLNEVLDE